jgi:hypothetical protein
MKEPHRMHEKPALHQFVLFVFVCFLFVVYVPSEISALDRPCFLPQRFVLGVVGLPHVPDFLFAPDLNGPRGVEPTPGVQVRLELWRHRLGVPEAVHEVNGACFKRRGLWVNIKNRSSRISYKQQQGRPRVICMSGKTCCVVTHGGSDT